MSEKEARSVLRPRGAPYLLSPSPPAMLHTTFIIVAGDHRGGRATHNKKKSEAERSRAKTKHKQEEEDACKWQ